MPGPSDGLPSIAIFHFTRVCNCRGITRENVADAYRNGVAQTGDELYEQALENRLADVVDGKAGKLTGTEMNPPDDRCRSCSYLFELAVVHMQRTAAAAVPGAITSPNAPPPPSQSV